MLTRRNRAAKPTIEQSRPDLQESRAEPSVGKSSLLARTPQQTAQLGVLRTFYKQQAAADECQIRIVTAWPRLSQSPPTHDVKSSSILSRRFLDRRYRLPELAGAHRNRCRQWGRTALPAPSVSIAPRQTKPTRYRSNRRYIPVESSVFAIAEAPCLMI